MPELPEVETIRRGLDELILQQKICEVKVFCAKSFQGDERAVLGRKIKKLRRFGKALVIDLSGGVSLMIHLRMTGQLIYDGEERYAAGHPSENFVADLPNRQTRVEFKLEKGRLYFNDQRKFGFVKLIQTDQIKKEAFIQKLAKEPWAMTPEELWQKLQKHQKAAIKSVLLDQTVVCGLGNIYADEALFEAKIHPKRQAGSLTIDETKTLLMAMRQVMDVSLQFGGSTMRNYVKADGSRGNYLDLFAKVYQREGQPCANCKTRIVKIKLAGRGTHFCPQCQIGGKND